MNPITPMIRIPTPDTLAMVRNSSLVGLRVSFIILVYSLNFNGMEDGYCISFAKRCHVPFKDYSGYIIYNFNESYH